ncbi:MAG TPA: TIGR00725 family protein [Solirubrobacteraceae bacterium]
MSVRARYIAVVGPGDATPQQERDAEVVGHELAAAGAIVVCGGLGGVMAAACRGAQSAGGVTVGLLPGHDRSTANPWLTVAIATGMGELRNGLVVRAADAVVAVAGGFGTLSEIALALKLGRPVVGLGTWDIAAPVARVDDPRAAVQRVLQLVTSLSQS